ncbi:MAG TPA: hypothetical protein VEN31_05500 [Candidatus Bathyarchaeia archaeon]|nr:hypothetical protein [Candidatus Bathyarchaeia archaeon]
MSGTSELGLFAVFGIMVVALLGRRNRDRPLRGRAARMVSGALLAIGGVTAVGALVLVALLASTR